MTGLPWGVMSADNHDLSRARGVLDEDHYDLEKIKERILEYLAVRKLRGTEDEGSDPLFRRASRRRQDVARPFHRSGARSQVRAHLPRRRAR